MYHIFDLTAEIMELPSTEMGKARGVPGKSGGRRVLELSFEHVKFKLLDF